MRQRREQRNKGGGGLTKREFLMGNFSINPHLQREIIIIKARRIAGEGIGAISRTKVSTGQAEVAAPVPVPG